MKKILKLILLFSLVSCSNNKTTDITVKDSANNTFKLFEYEGELFYMPNYVERISYEIYGFSYYSELYLKESATIDPNITISFDKGYVGWSVDHGLSPDERNENYDIEKNRAPNGHYYLYFGKITQISDGIYSCKGSYLPSLKEDGKQVSDEIDFYLVFKENNKMYMIFEDLNINQLYSYEDNAYYLFERKINPN